MIKLGKKIKKYIREIDPYDFDLEKFFSIVSKTEVEEFQYLLMLLDKIINQNFDDIDPELGRALIDAKKNKYYELKYWFFFPPQRPSKKILGASNYVILKNEELDMNIIIFGESHDQGIFEDDFIKGYPIWHWLTEKAKIHPIDVYTESLYRRKKDLYFADKYSDNNINTNSPISFIGNLPFTEHFLRIHHCDIRRDFVLDEEDQFTKFQDLVMRPDHSKIYENLEDLKNILIEKNLYKQIIAELCGLKNMKGALEFFLKEYLKIFRYPEGYNIKDFIKYTEPHRKLINKQLRNCRLPIRMVVDIFLDSLEVLTNESSGMFPQLIFSMLYDAYTLFRSIRTYEPDTIQFSPKNYTSTDAKFAIFFEGLSHQIFHERFFTNLGFVVTDQHKEKTFDEKYKYDPKLDKFFTIDGEDSNVLDLDKNNIDSVFSPL